MKHKLLLLFLVFTSTFFSCRKDDDTPCDNKDYHYNLSEEDKSKVPYTGYDTLVFVSNTNDTAICIGQGKKQFYLRTVIPNYTINNCSIPSTDNYEAYNYKFSSNNSKFKIELDQYKKNENGLEYIFFQFNKIYFILYNRRVGNPNSNNFIDSILVKDKWFKNVSMASRDFNSQYDNLYYNKNFGILKIQNADSSEVWELLTKK